MYRAVHPVGYRYSQYCEHYRQFARQRRPSMRHVHRAGEKLFIDFAGTRPHVVDRHTGERIPVELFVGSVGASGSIYEEATRTQDLAAWVGAHIRLLEACGGSPALWIPDNFNHYRFNHYRLKPVDFWRLKVALRLKPPEGARLTSRLKARRAR
jgi:transposase